MSNVSAAQRRWLNSAPHRWYIRRQVPRFLKACPEPFRGQVLEVGAGAGATSQRILETFPQVELTATDIDTAANNKFAQLQGRYGRRLKVQAADVLHLPFDREAFDFVLAINVLPHLDAGQLPTAVEQMMRVLRAGGLLGLSTTVWPWLKKTSAVEIEKLLTNNQCVITYRKGEASYDIWARKSYPV